MILKYYTDMPGAGYDNQFQFCQIVQLHDDISEVESQVINLYPELTYEIFEGFGGAVTEAAAYRTPEKPGYTSLCNRTSEKNCIFHLGLVKTGISKSRKAHIHRLSFYFIINIP